MMRRLTLVLLSAAAAGCLSGCGAGASTSHTGSVTSAITSRAHTSPVTAGGNGKGDPGKVVAPPLRLVHVRRVAFGVALVDRRGFALYRFTHDTRATSTCYGACARAWPPYLVPRRLGRGSAYGGLPGTVRRADGRIQVTYAGHPLYH